MSIEWKISSILFLLGVNGTGVYDLLMIHIAPLNYTVRFSGPLTSLNPHRVRDDVGDGFIYEADPQTNIEI